jgi:alkaline phosphatase
MALRHLKIFPPDADYWLQLGRDAIMESLKGSADINTNLAKNVIIFIGDGMSLPTVTAARIYKAQYKAREAGEEANGEESYLTFEKLTHVGLSKVSH